MGRKRTSKRKSAIKAAAPRRRPKRAGALKPARWDRLIRPELPRGAFGVFWEWASEADERAYSRL
jgi:hypothetical protein